METALSEWKAPGPIGTLAAVYAESGRFEEAVRWQRKALDLGYQSKSDQEKARQCLKRYEQGKPYRDDEP